MYKVIPFHPVVKSNKNAVSEIAIQQEKIINDMSEENWEYVGMDSITTIVQNGCIAGLLGNPQSLTNVQTLVFRKR